MIVPIEKPPLAVVAHVGVKGMHWGVRKKEETSDRKSSGSENNTRSFYSRHKKTILIGAGVTVAVLGTYGAYKLHDAKVQKLISQRNQLEGIPFNRKDSLARKMTAEQIMKEVIPGVNPGHGTIPGTSNNCLRCSFAYELRRRGFNVRAGRTLMGSDQSPEGMVQALSGGGLRDRLSISGLGENHIPVIGSVKQTSSRIFETLGKMKEGSRGELGVEWGLGGGHSMSWEIIGGKPHIFDTQSGRHFASAEEFQKIAECIYKAGFTRLDNVDLNEEFLKDWVANVH